MIIKDIHENLLTGIQTMLVNPLIDLPYYGEFNLHVNFSESKSISTCAVNVTSKGMNFYYSSEFLEKLTQKEINFIILHEDFHLLFDHPSRTVSGNYKHELSNIVQDMIINHVIWEDISHDFVEIPKGEDGKNMALFVPKEYTGKLIFEELYEWMSDKKDEHDRKKKQKSEDKQKSEQDGDQGSGQGKGKPSDEYGPYGQGPNGDGTLDTYSLDKLFEDMDNGSDGEYLDKHIENEVSDEVKSSMVNDIKDKLSARGLLKGSAESTLNKLVKKRKDYLKKIKRTISNVIFGSNKVKSITKRNRRNIEGIKGKRKIKSMINVGLDTSGSMGGTFERVLSYIYQNDIEVNFMESDTEVRWVKKLKSKKDIEAIPIKGLGGTCLQPMIDHIANNFNNLGTVLLTDGYTDSLDFSKIKGKTLILSVGVKCPISHDNGRVTQIVLEK
jgi:predicted metal-dependent peptidase